LESYSHYWWATPGRQKFATEMKSGDICGEMKNKIPTRTRRAVGASKGDSLLAEVRQRERAARNEGRLETAEKWAAMAAQMERLNKATRTS